MIESFLAFCRADDPRFLCYPAGIYGDADERAAASFVAHVEHRLDEPAAPVALDALNERLGDLAPDYRAFYAASNGALLFADTLSDSAGIAIGAIEDWDELTAEWRDWLNDVEIDDPDNPEFEDDDEDYDFVAIRLPSWVNTAIAIAEAPHSANYFILALEDEVRGNIYYFDHEVLEPELFATGFNEFLARLVYCDAPRLLMHLGAFARYSDGRTDEQWLPAAYLTGDQE